MLYWAAVFLVVALVAMVFGFGAAAGAVLSFIQLLFFIAQVLCVIALVVGLLRDRAHRL